MPASQFFEFELLAILIYRNWLSHFYMPTHGPLNYHHFVEYLNSPDAPHFNFPKIHHSSEGQVLHDYNYPWSSKADRAAEYIFYTVDSDYPWYLDLNRPGPTVPSSLQPIVHRLFNDDDNMESHQQNTNPFSAADSDADSICSDSEHAFNMSINYESSSLRRASSEESFSVMIPTYPRSPNSLSSRSASPLHSDPDPESDFEADASYEPHPVRPSTHKHVAGSAARNKLANERRKKKKKQRSFSRALTSGRSSSSIPLSTTEPQKQERRRNRAANPDDTFRCVHPGCSAVMYISDVEGLFAHIKEKHSSTPGTIYECGFDFCIHTTDKLHDIRRHIQSHLPPSFVCTKCDQSFCREDSYLRHCQRHRSK